MSSRFRFDADSRISGYLLQMQEEKNVPSQDFFHYDFLLIPSAHIEEATDTRWNNVASLHQHSQVEHPLVAVRGIRKRRKQKRVSK